MMYGLRGGQGREPGEIEGAAWVVMVCITLLIFVALASILGCTRPTMYHERDGNLKPNTPSARELRESLGVF
jgi:hypothetical protein